MQNKVPFIKILGGVQFDDLISYYFLPTVGYEVPNGTKEEPCDSIGHNKDKERAAPVEVHQRGEDVGQVAVRLPHVAVLHVATAVLLDVTLPLTPSPS